MLDILDKGFIRKTIKDINGCKRNKVTTIQEETSIYDIIQNNNIKIKLETMLNDNDIEDIFINQNVLYFDLIEAELNDCDIDILIVDEYAAIRKNNMIISFNGVENETEYNSLNELISLFK